MILTYFILAVILGYSGFILLKSYRNWKAGKSCTQCTGCSLNGACPVQKLKLESIQTETLHYIK